MLTAEQIELRKTGIGSSEIATICGENPFKSPHDVWLAKRGLVEEETDNLSADLGHALEPFVARQYEVDSGRKVRRHQETLRLAGSEFALATIDYETDDSEQRIVECKTVGGRVAHHWEKSDRGCPPYVQIQAQWQMGVLGRERCDVAALFLGFTDFRVYCLQFRPDVFDSLLTIGAEFWARVQAGEPPSVDESEACRRALLERYQWKRTELELAPAGFDELLVERAETKKECDRLEKRLGLIENEIRAQIGEGAGFYSDWGRVTHKEDINGKRSLRFYAAAARKKAA
jgi:putative phage-type endonuclease